MKNCTTKFTNNNDPAHCFVNWLNRYIVDSIAKLTLMEPYSERQLRKFIISTNRKSNTNKSTSKPASAQLIGTSIYRRYLISQFSWHSILCGFIIAVSTGKYQRGHKTLQFKRSQLLFILQKVPELLKNFR